jgi:hypothetical protein
MFKAEWETGGDLGLGIEAPPEGRYLVKALGGYYPRPRTHRE